MSDNDSDVDTGVVGGPSLGEMLKEEMGGVSAAEYVKRNRAVTAVIAAKSARVKAAAAAAAKAEEYTTKDLAGIEVQHGEEAFEEGREVILTLKDSKILDDKGTSVFL